MDFISFDIETTGTLSHVDLIIEIAGVKFVNGQSKDVYKSFVQIDRKIPEEASRVNGITDDMLQDQPKIKQVLGEFTDFCGETLMVAHNAIFDFQFLARALQETKSPAPQGLVVDTYSLSRKVFPQVLNYKLATLCSHLKIKTGTFHRAEADALACGFLFKKILEKLEGKSLKDVISFSGKKPLKFPRNVLDRQMSFFN